MTVSTLGLPEEAKDNIIGALLHRLGGKATFNAEELDNPKGRGVSLSVMGEDTFTFELIAKDAPLLPGETQDGD